MKTLQEKISCLQKLLIDYDNEFDEEIEKLNKISQQEEYDNFLTELAPLLAKSHKDLLPKINLCQNINSPKEINKIDLS